jgi:hypothetical protein
MLHKMNLPTYILPHFTLTFFSHIWSFSRRTAFHIRTAIRFNDVKKRHKRDANAQFRWNHQHSCSHAMVFPTKCKRQLPDILSDSLWVGRAGDRIPVWARFSAPLQTDPGAHPASYVMGTGFHSRG